MPARKVQRDQIVPLVQEGLSVRAIADRLQVSRQGMYARMRREQIAADSRYQAMPRTCECGCGATFHPTAPNQRYAHPRKRHKRRNERIKLRNEGKQRCCDCGEIKILGEFALDRSRPSGRQPRCRRCYSDYHRQRKASAPIAGRKGKRNT